MIVLSATEAKTDELAATLLAGLGTEFRVPPESNAGEPEGNGPRDTSVGDFLYRNHDVDMAAFGELVRSLGRDLSQPLAAILNYARGARRLEEARAPHDERIGLALDRIAEQAQRISEHLESLRDLARIRRAPFERLDLNVIVAEMARLVVAAATRSACEVGFLLAPSLPLIHGDSSLLGAAVGALVRNAIEAVERVPIGQRHVTIRTSRGRNRLVQVTVEDSGTGVDSDLIGRLFEPFVTTKANALGIGLTLVQSVAESHGGRAGQLRRTRADGTAFRIEIPGIPQPAIKR